MHCQIQEIKIKFDYYRSFIEQMSRIELGVHYYLDFLQIKKNSLFTRIKIYLISDGVKRVVAQGKQIQNNRIIIETTISEHKTLVFNEVTQLYEPSFTTFQLQFQTEGKFIKMGETVINVSEIANSKRSEHREAFKIEKCLDRNARLWLKLLFFSQTLKWASKPLLQSHSYGKMSEIYSTRKITLPERLQVNKTEYSINQHEGNRDNYDILSQARTNLSKKYLIDRQNLQRTQAPNQNYREIEEISQLQQELSISNTDLRLTRQQLAAIKTNYCELLQANQNLQGQLRQSHTEHFKIANYCDELQEKIKRLEISFESQRDTLNSQVLKYKNLYHQSQQQRNKLLVTNQQNHKQERQKRRELETKLIQSQDRIKQLLGKDQDKTAQLKQSAAEIQVFKKTIQKEQSLRYKQRQEINQLKATIKQINKEFQKQAHQNAQLKKKNSQLLNQLELCRFTLSELQKEIVEGKQKIIEKDEILQRYQAQIEKEKEVRQKEMHRYSTELQRVQQEAKQEARSLEEYIEELETKTINDYSKLNELDRLRKEIASLNNALVQQQDRFKDLQSDHEYLLSDKRSLQKRLEEQQALTLKLTRQKMNVQTALKVANEQQMEILEMMNSQKQSQEERELMIERRCEDRDNYWQGEVDKIQKDTLTLIERWKKEKQYFVLKIEELQSETKSREQDLNTLSQRYKQVQSQMREHKKTLTQKDGQCKSLTIQVDKLLSQLATKEKKIQHLSGRLNSFEALEAAVNSSELKLSLKTKEIDTIRTQLQQQTPVRIKQRNQTIQLILAIANFLANPQKLTNINQDFKNQFLDYETSVMISTALQTFCEKHNKMKEQLQNIQVQKEELSKKQRQIQKANKSLLEKRSASKTSLHREENDVEGLNHSPRAFRNKQNRSPIKEENQSIVTLTLIKQQNQSLRQRLQRQESKNRDLEHQIHRLEKDNDSLQSQIKRLSDQIDQKSEETSNFMLKLTSKQNQIQLCREEIKDILSQLSQTKARLEEATRLLQQERTKASLKKPQPLNSSPSKADQPFKVIELERRLQLIQGELDRVKTQKQDRRREEGSSLKQIKQLEIKLRDKESLVSELKKQAESEKTRFDQEREMLLFREKKLKQELQEQAQSYHKAERDLKEKIVEEQQKLKQAEKKIKNLQENLKNLGTQVSNAHDREERTKRMITTESDLKTRSLQIEHQNQQAVLKRVIEQQKLIEKSLRDKIQLKEVQILRLTNQIQRRQLIIADCKAQLDLYRMRVTNFEEEEGQYKETIEVLQNKIKADSNKASRRNIEKGLQSIQLQSNPSLRDFSFR